jgi:hypothetical protein
MNAGLEKTLKECSGLLLKTTYTNYLWIQLGHSHKFWPPL